MNLDHQIATTKIAAQLHDAEAALNEALIKIATLNVTLLQVRRTGPQNSLQGQPVLMRLAKSQQTMIAAGNDLARVHGGLLEIATTEGYLEECPPNKPMKPNGVLKAA